ncbi:MAG: ABC transporter ATP-binding protein, partial [Rubrivivax sp.]
MPFAAFERLVDPYPDAPPALPPKGLFPFLWACSDGMRAYIGLMTLSTALIGAFEAALFAVLGRMVDWLAEVPPSQLWTDRGPTLVGLGLVLAGSVALAGLQTMLKHQTLAGNMPMRLRWNFHRLMLAQSMSFFQDEFAGRIATKVMQSALAVRDTWMIVADILVYVLIYFATMGLVLGGFDARVLAPFLGWVVLYAAATVYFVPRLARVAQAQADARSLMTGRITDAYTNIATVKLFSHSNREAGYARSAMQEFLFTVHRQMRLVSAFQVVNHALSMLLIAATGGVVLWLWTRGEAGIGAVAASTAMALRLNGISHWVMWEMASLFEHVGTVQDGIATLTRPQALVDRPGATALRVTRGELRFEGVGFAYGNGRRVVDDLTLHVRPGEKIGLVGRSGAGKSTLVNLLLRFHDLQSGRILIDGQDIVDVTQDTLRANIGMVTQDTSLLHRSVRENIVYGRPDASEEALREAAARAEAEDFIAQLVDPKGRIGYDAHVGERGVKLSGGQRQR